MDTSARSSTKEDKDRSDRERDRKHRHHDKDTHEGRHKKHKSSSSSSSKSRHHDHDDGEDRHRHHRHKSSSSRHGKDKDRSPRSSRRSGHDTNDVAEGDEEDLWVEKEIPGVDSTPIQTEASTSAGPKPIQSSGVEDQPSEDSVLKENDGPKRDSWMMDDSGMDFGLMGALKVKKPKEDKPDPEKLHISSRELNVHLKAGLHVDQYPENNKPSYTIGDAGSSWRMTKLKRVMETAAEEGVSPAVIGVERYGSIEKFNEAMEERRELDRRASKKKDRRSDRGDSGRDNKRSDKRDYRRDDSKDDRSRNDNDRRRDDDDSRRGRDDRPSKSGRLSEFSSAASSPFQRPMDEEERLEKGLARRNREKEREKDQEKRFTPIPSPFATHVSSPIPHATEPTMTPGQLNKLKAKAIRAKMLGTPDAEALEKEYEQAQKAAAEVDLRSPDPVQRTVVIQAMGSSSPAPLGPGNKKVPGKSKKEATHDEQGNRIAYQGEEGDLDLHELVRREKLGLEEGMDKELARRITRDAVFKDDLDYMDDNADKIARTVKKNDTQLKSAAIHDYRKTQSALDHCTMCFKDDGRTPPIMPVLSMGNRVYLGLPLYKEFLPGHCMIVPIQHVTSTLECDDDAWDEIRNFMKCLIQMNAAEDKAIIFFETVINLTWQKHTVIECIPIPWDAGQTAPGYFKEAILSADEEWSQHRKLIETDAKDPKNGGFRRRLTSKLPYFHVWFGSPDKGYGHVIEDADRFQDYFAKEVLASICEMDSLQWSRRNNKKIPSAENPRRVEAFKKGWQAWDWTRTLEGKQ
ncbi:CwfJ C-terminus 1-domain-containing protein-like protein [Dissophora ornata]|nr:CwfJ C-terminus 1-domain-containing protein-like protein [Dissophora ornata]